MYRALIRGKIFKNNADGTPDSILEAIREIIQGVPATVVDNEDFTFSINFNDSLNSTHRYILSNFGRMIIPVPQAVSFTGFSESPKVVQFGRVIWGSEEAQFTPPTFGL